MAEQKKVLVELVKKVGTFVDKDTAEVREYSNFNIELDINGTKTLYKLTLPKEDKMAKVVLETLGCRTVQA